MDTDVINTREGLPIVSLRIGANLQSAGSAGAYQHINPYTGLGQAVVPMGGPAEVDAAVQAASEAFSRWKDWKPSKRRDVLLKLGDLLAEKFEDFAQIGAWENGTPVSTGRFLAGFAREWCVYYAGWADKLGASTVVPGATFSYSLSEPYGVIGIIVAWNNPLAFIGMKVIPALAAGNTVVIKPSELAPFQIELFAELADLAGIPAGVINVVPGSAEAAVALIDHPLVEKVSFTGGTDTGRKVLAGCAKNLKPAVMELGGKSANIIFDDADLDRAADDVVRRSLASLSGQACIMGSRVLVQDRVYDAFATKVANLARTLRAGDPTDPSTELGPVISASARDRILDAVGTAADSDGVEVIAGGRGGSGELSAGFFVEPTVITGASPDSDIAQMETFGPVVVLFRFTTEDEAVELANNTDYGLAAFVQTQDVSRVHRLASRLKAGSVYINGAATVQPEMPFGGVGASGYGREGGREGIDEFLRSKTVAIGRINS